MVSGMKALPITFLVLITILPLRGLAATIVNGPTITSIDMGYPMLYYAPLPNSFSHAYQTAFKDGDETYFAIQVTDSNPVHLGTADASALGIIEPISISDTGNVNGETHYFQSGFFTIDTDGANGTIEIPITVTDDAGESDTKVFSIKIDNRTPRFSITKFVPYVKGVLKQRDLLSLSGKLDGTGTISRLFEIFMQLIDAHGNPVSGGSGYYGSQEGLVFSDLREGVFSNLLFPFLEDSDLVSQADGLRLTLLGKDEAGNIGTTSSIMVFSSNTASTSTSTPTQPPATGDGISNVLFLPGMESVRLYAPEDAGCDARVSSCTEQKLWEPYGNTAVQTLVLDHNGRSIRPDIYTKPNDVITSFHDVRTHLSKNLYSSFFAMLDTLKSTENIADWRPVAYDWRLSIDDLLTRGSERNGKIFYADATSTPYIEQTLRSLAESSKTGKVTIIAHSNGGLIAKALLQRLGSEEAGRLVDKVILIAVPQSGAAKDVATMLYGYGGALPFDACAEAPLIGPLCSGSVDRSTARTFAEHAPVAYHLLPSSAYFKSVTDGRHHVIEFNANHAFEAERTLYKSAINSLSELHSFLQAKEGGRSKPAPEDLSVANVLTNTLIEYASTTHATLNTWVPPSTIQVHQIAGIGKSTLSGIDYYDYALPAGLGFRGMYRPILTQEGDGVVAAQSEVQMKATTNVHSYWLKLNQIGIGPIGSRSHSDITETAPVQNLIENLLQDKTTVPSELLTSRPAATSFEKKLMLILHSPLTLELYDAEDRHTGVTASGSFEENIPDAEYGELGEVKYISIPSDGTYKVVMKGIDDGIFTLEIQEIENDVVTTTTTFADVPASSETTATVTVIGGSQVTISPLEVQSPNKDVISLTPKIDAVVRYVPPTIPKNQNTVLPIAKPAISTSVKTATTTKTKSPEPAAVPSPLPKITEVGSSSPALHATSTVSEIAQTISPEENSTSLLSPNRTQSASVLVGITPSFVQRLISLFTSLLHKFTQFLAQFTR